MYSWSNYFYEPDKYNEREYELSRALRVILEQLTSETELTVPGYYIYKTMDGGAEAIPIDENGKPRRKGDPIVNALLDVLQDDD